MTRTPPLLFLLYLLSASTPLVSAQGDQDIHVLSEKELHHIAWPPAREEFNRKCAAGEFNIMGETPVMPLAEDAFQKPTEIRHEDDQIIVFYGAPSGPLLSVLLTQAGKVLAVRATYANF